MKELSLIFPHQLFEEHPALEKGRDVFLVEDPLFFGDKRYPLKFHKMKLTFHRASMKAYEEMLRRKKYTVHYFEYSDLNKERSSIFKFIKEMEYKSIHMCESDDFILKKRILTNSDKLNIKLNKYRNPSFINDEEYLREYFSNKKRYFQHYFYVDQRKKYEIMVDNGSPLNGKWSFDSENRKSIPKDLKIPDLVKISSGRKFINEAQDYVNKNFPNNPGENEDFYIPIDFKSAKVWLEDFLQIKLKYFGDYQDAILDSESFLFHSLLSPLINSGLLTSEFVIKESLEFSRNNSVPINSLEGFIRQILGWREFIRAVYTIEGVNQRNSNFWGNTRKLPKSFYNGTTGIDPVDITIKKVLKTGYNHHIERLMILGNFMLLCEINPNEIYNWFMEMYIDAYDWVMVPNVYGMSQFADGGLMSTKPYISSSNYIKKMSNFKKGEWTKIWDSLFWNFINTHRDYFTSNNRTVFIGRNLEKMPVDKLQSHLKTADAFLSHLK